MVDRYAKNNYKRNIKTALLMLVLPAMSAIAGPYDVILQPSSTDATPYTYAPPSSNRSTPVPIPVGSGLTLITDMGNGNYSTFSEDRGLTLINSNNGFTTITPSDNRPMTICSGSSCFQP